MSTTSFFVSSLDCWIAAVCDAGKLYLGASSAHRVPYSVILFLILRVFSTVFILWGECDCWWKWILSKLIPLLLCIWLAVQLLLERLISLYSSYLHELAVGVGEVSSFMDLRSYSWNGLFLFLVVDGYWVR